MKVKLTVWWLGLAVLLSLGTAAAGDYESLKLINATNWANYFNGLIADPGESRGALQCRPADAYLLSRVLPPGLKLKIKTYKLEKDDPAFLPDSIPALAEMTSAADDVEKIAALLRAQSSEVVVYPALNKLFIKVNGKPYARVEITAGPPEAYYPVQTIAPDQPIVWDAVPALPTVPGEYSVLAQNSRYLSGTYYNESVVPFGAWLARIGGNWAYKEGERWFKLPAAVAADLDLPAGQRRFRYYDLDERAGLGRWGGNPFGRDVIYFSARAGEFGYPNLIFAPGELVFEQTMLVKDLVYLLTVEGPDDFDSCAAGSADLRNFTNAAATAAEPRELAAAGEYNDNRLPRGEPARRTALGLYYYRHGLDESARQQRAWFEKLKGNWGFLRQLREELRTDFAAMGVFSLENRQNILEGWLNDRLAFGQALPPSEAKFVQLLSFSNFFKPAEQASTFNAREKAVMLNALSRAVSGAAAAFDLRSVTALNDYNFGRLLNDILGDLYKSHGCLHVSPRHSYLLYELLPAGSRINIHKYGEAAASAEVNALPLLADLVNFSDDLEKLKTSFSATAEVRVEVYPSSGLWVIYVKDKPLAWLTVKGGPQTPFNLVEGRDAKGRPIFQDALAYPTTPGRYRVFDRVKDYVSTLYYDQTIVPMGGRIWKEAGGWWFLERNGQRRSLPDSLSSDLDRPAEARQLTFYDEVKNASGEAVEAKWGDQPFGTYCLRTTLDGRQPSPELIHSSGDLIMEERQLINDLILVMSAPYDGLEDCIGNSPNFDLYRTCDEFINDPGKGELLGVREKANYKLYYDLPLTSGEAAVLPADSLAAAKALKGRPLSAADQQALIAAGAAVLKQGVLRLDRPKLAGLGFDIHQYVVTIEKYAHHYTTLKQYWGGLSGLRGAMLADFNNFVLKDPVLFNNFMRELMLARARLERLDNAAAARLLDRLIAGAVDK